MEQERVEEIKVDFPEASSYELRMSIGPGTLRLRPQPGGSWVDGTYRDPSGSIPSRVSLSGGSLHISQERKSLRSLRRSPEFDLKVGDAHPFAVDIDGGANVLECDFGGLPITSFQSQLGAGKIRYDASAPNPVELDHLRVSAGAADFTIKHLANFNAADIVIDGGAASFRIDFGGELRRDCHAKISTGVASVEITIPKTTAVKLTTHTAMGSRDIGDGFITRSGSFWSEAAVNESGPVLTLEASASMGSLKVRLI
jgi:hypothetical protein